jgi:hypothetical protein
MTPMAADWEFRMTKASAAPVHVPAGTDKRTACAVRQFQKFMGAGLDIVLGTNSPARLAHAADTWALRLVSKGAKASTASAYRNAVLRH